MAIQGLRDSNLFPADERPKNWRETILRLEPNGTAPLTALTAAMKSRTTDDPEFNWFEKEQQGRRVAAGANLNSTDSVTDLTVVAGAKAHVEGDLLLVENTGEIVQVIADPTSDTSLRVARAQAGTSATTLDYDGAGVNPNLVCIGSAFEEGSLPPTGVAHDPTKKYNYTQIFRRTLEMTRTASKTRLRTGDAVKEAKRECLEVFSIDMERAFWFGKRHQTTKNGKPLRFTGGVDQFIASDNIVTANTSTGCDMETLEEYLKQIFTWGSSEKMAFMGNTAMKTIGQIVRKNSTMHITPGIKEYGMNVMRLTCPFGELVMKTHPLFNQMPGGTTGSGSYYGRDSYMYVLDMKSLQYVPLIEGDVKYEKDLQANGLDGMQSGYIAEVGLEINHPKTHFLVKNLAKAATDS